MFNRTLLSYLLLTGILATALPESAWCLGDDTGERQPADQPVKENDEKEEAEKEELKDGDDHETLGVIADTHVWTTRTWTLHDLGVCLTHRIFQHGPEHCRAPPALLI